MANLLNRIADYFMNDYTGDDETAPKMEMSVSDLREIANLHVVKCKLEAELKRYKVQKPIWVPVEAKLPEGYAGGYRLVFPEDKGDTE